MTFLLANWRWIAVAGFVAIYSAFVYRIGGASPRAELKAYKAEAKAQLEQAKHDKERADRDYQMDIINREFAWSEWLRTHPVQTKRTVARVCADDPGNQRLSAAIDEYRAELVRVRQEIRQCYIDADRLQAQLINVNQWANSASAAP